MMKVKKLVIILALLVVMFVLVFCSEKFLDRYIVRILNLIAINVILALSMTLTNGFTGLFSLGAAGFMSIGAYTTALLTMSVEGKAMNFFMEPQVAFLASLHTPFIIALVIGGLLAAAIGFLVASPVLRLRGDYLAIATLGFGEIVCVVFVNLQKVTNGALGLKGIPTIANMYWTWGLAAFAVIFIAAFISSSYGRALKSIREDEVAAQAMGINIFRSKILAFTISAFFAGIGGGLTASLIATIDPNMFRFTLTFQVLLMIVLGGMKSITGSIVGATLVTVLLELLRAVESSVDLGFVIIPGVPGMRMLVFSGILIIVVIFLREGIVGERELSWRIFGIKEDNKYGSS